VQPPPAAVAAAKLQAGEIVEDHRLLDAERHAGNVERARKQGRTAKGPSG
jgi:hypothetical protein